MSTFFLFNYSHQFVLFHFSFCKSLVIIFCASHFPWIYSVVSFHFVGTTWTDKSLSIIWEIMLTVISYLYFYCMPKTMLVKPNLKHPSIYDLYISICIITENTQLSAWLNKCLFPLTILLFCFLLEMGMSRITCGAEAIFLKIFVLKDLHCLHKLTTTAFPTFPYPVIWLQDKIFLLSLIPD
jgi:hypothetical protein